MAYFDNAATSWPKPQEVYDFMDSFARERGGNAGRGTHKGAMAAAAVAAGTRARLQTLLRCPSKRIIFEPSATIALNVIIQGMIAKGARNIYVSPFEHNAVTRVLHHFEALSKISVSVLKIDGGLRFDFERMKFQFDERKPDMVIASLASNVCGIILPVEKIFSLAKKYGAVTVVDMAQTAGLVDLNVGSSDIDFAVFAGHKTLLGPTGIAGFAMSDGVDLPPLIFGGTGSDSANQDMPESLPQKHEAGSANIFGMAGLYASLGWILREGVGKIHETAKSNRSKLLNIFKNFDFVKIAGESDGAEYIDVVSILIDGVPSDSAGAIFDERDIAVRCGLQCAPLAHKTLGTFPAGTVRFSAGYFTSDEDFAQLEKAMREIGEEL